MPLPNTGNVPRPRSQGFNARLDTLLLRLVETGETPLDITTVDQEPEQLNTNENPEDFHPSVGKVYSRSEFYGGEGLAFAHRKTNKEDDYARYWSSDSINIDRPELGGASEITLLREMVRRYSANYITRLKTTSNGYLWAHSGSSLRILRFESPLVNPLVVSGTEAPSGTPNFYDLAVLNDTVYGVASANIQVRSNNTSAGTWSVYSNLASLKIWAAKERIFATGYPNSNELYQVGSGSSSILLHALGSNHTWTDVCEFTGGILACASDGNIYMFTFDTDEQTFDLSLYSRTKFEGEIPYSIVQQYNNFLISTYRKAESTGYYSRLYSAKLAETYTLDIQLIKEFGNQTSTADHRIFNMLSVRGAFYVGVPDPDNGLHTVWKYNLGTNALSANVSHTYTPAGGAGVEAIRDIAMINNRLIYGVSGTIGDQGIHVEQDTFKSSGNLILPLADFHTSAEKVWVTAFIDADFPTGTELDFFLSTDPEAITDINHASWTNVISGLAAPLTSELRLTNVQSRYLTAYIKPYSNTAKTLAPSVRSVSFRAFAGPSDFRITIPVNVSDVIHIPGRRRIRTKGLGRQLHDQLKVMQGQDTELEIYSPSIKVLGVVEKVSERIPRGWLRGFPVAVCYVTVVGTRIPD